MNINISNPAIDSSGKIYICANKSIYSLNPDGTLYNKFNIIENVSTSDPAISKDGIIYFTSEDHILYAYYLNGTLKWKFHALGYLGSSIIGNDGTIYFVALCENNNGGKDCCLYAVGNNKTEPSSPINLKAYSGNNYVLLDWSQPSLFGDYYLLKYKIYRGMSSGKEEVLNLIEINNTQYLDKNVLNGHIYFYYITAENNYGESMPSNEVEAIPDSTNIDIEKPNIEIEYPYNNSLLNSKEIMVQGIASDNVAIIEVDLSIDGRCWFLANGTENWHAKLNLTNGKNTIFVRAIDPAGNVEISNVNIVYKKNVNRTNLSTQFIDIIIFIIIFFICLMFYAYSFNKKKLRNE